MKKLTDKTILELVKSNTKLYEIVFSYSNDNQKYKDLINAINYKYDCNCISLNRQQENVKGRAILVKILKKKGLTNYTIATIIGMHHTSVNYYYNKCVFQNKRDIDFINKNFVY